MIKISPITASHYQVTMPGQSIDIATSNVPGMMEALHAQAPGQIELSLKGNDFSAHTDVVDKALELAGLSSFQAAQQTSIGKVVF